MKIGDLRHRLFMHYNCMWNGVVRDVTAELEHHEEEVSELDTANKLLEIIKKNAHLDRDFPWEQSSRITELFKESV
jgi:hypothetical protein